MKSGNFSLLIEWFKKEKRDLPWRIDKTPYSVLVSEVMLQQTRAEVVIPYYTRWMICFPTVKALAKASLEEVIKTWEGLGYYSRARNLHAAACLFVDQYDGEIPSSYEQLIKIRGLGPYTASAILCFAYSKRAFAIDGNVARVLSRFYAIEDSLPSLKAISKMTDLLDKSLPKEDFPFAMEGLIELGSQICKKTPQCVICPINTECKAYKEGKTHLFPVMKKQPKTIKIYRIVPIIRWEDCYLVQRIQEGKVMGGLFEFPSFEKIDETGIDQALKRIFPFDMDYIKDLDEVTHSFTRYQATLYPSIWHIKTYSHFESFIWKKKDELSLLPFSSGHRKILQRLLREDA